MSAINKPVQKFSAASGLADFCLDFTVQHWCLWQSLDTVSKTPWAGGELLAYNGGGADVSFLPMMQSRRLSPLARAACSVAWQCRQLYGAMPSVFLSQHGESHYYFEILEDLARQEEVSPSRFSLSVHNAVAGLFSIHSESTCSYVSLAGGTEGVFAAFLEAAGLLLETPKVLIVCYEQALPEAYRSYLSTTESTWALAMVVARNNVAGHRLQLTRTAYHNKGTTEDSGRALVQSILTGQRHSACHLEHSSWQWSFTDATD